MRRVALRRQAEAIVLVAIGGYLGANIRFFLGATAGESLISTVSVNVIGCFGLGLLLYDLHGRDVLSHRFRITFGTGFFASFTTYSTFIADIVLSEPVVGFSYLFVSYVGGFLAILASGWTVRTFGLTEGGVEQ